MICPSCETEYERLGSHWYWNEGHRPALTDYQREIITGLMMSDGTLERGGENPFLTVSMITKEYIDWLDVTFTHFSTGTDLHRTASEKAKDRRKYGFDESASSKDYHNMWRFRTCSLPELSDFNWYTGDSGKKVWPEDIDLTPTVLTHWFVGDGHWKNRESSDHISIAASNEFENKDKIDNYFTQANLPTPSNYNKYKTNNTQNMELEFTVEDSYTIFEYMDPAPPGFGYKFPDEYISTE